MLSYEKLRSRSQILIAESQRLLAKVEEVRIVNDELIVRSRENTALSRKIRSLNKANINY
jgi:hypothetical protein